MPYKPDYTPEYPNKILEIPGGEGLWLMEPGGEIVKSIKRPVPVKRLQTRGKGSKLFKAYQAQQRKRKK